MRPDILRLALEALRTNKFDEFEVALSQPGLPDSFSVLLSPEVAGMLARELEGRVADWIIRTSTWNVEWYGPHTTPRPGETFLQVLWRDLVTKLRPKLTSLFQHITLPAQGAILCFFGGSGLTVVVRYQRFPGGAIDLRPIVAEERPHGVFELRQLLAGASPIQRSLLKDSALSPNKLVFQRGALVHVDRQYEDVFGPTIDTIILAELLAAWIEARRGGAPITALEVGVGSGLLYIVLASRQDDVERAYGTDLNPTAVACTLKNLEINGLRLDAVRPQLRVRGEKFDRHEFGIPVDLIVCNPPYIPDPPAAGGDIATGHQLAVGGLVLCRDLLESLESLLRPEGRLLLMMSSVSASDVDSFIPKSFEARRAFRGPGWRVPLDVDVVWEHSDWQERLLRDNRIERDGEGTLWHYLQPAWIVRKGENLP